MRKKEVRILLAAGLIIIALIIFVLIYSSIPKILPSPPTCEPNWTVHNTSCKLDDIKEYYYIDENSCGDIKTMLFENKEFGVWSPDITWSDIMVADVNSDGLDDVIGKTSAGDWWAGISNGINFSDTYFSAWSSEVEWVDVQVADINGDNKTDVIGRVAGNGNWWVGISNGINFTNTLFGNLDSSISWLDVMKTDVNGDGKDDFIARNNTGEWVAGINNGNNFTNVIFGAWSNAVTWNDVMIADVNGDGKADVIGRLDNGNWWAGVNNGVVFVNQLFGNWPIGFNWLDVQVADVNGDGKDDVIGRAEQTGDWIVSISIGTGFNNSIFSSWNTVPWSNAIALDLNGDNKDDIIGREAGGDWWAGVSTGTSYEKFYLGSWADAIWDVMKADLNGDGREDIIGRTNTGVWLWMAGISTGIINTTDNPYQNTTEDCDYDNNNIIGNFTQFNQTNIDLKVYINGSLGKISENFITERTIEFREGSLARIKFNYDFENEGTLNFRTIEIIKQPVSSGIGYLIVKGIEAEKTITIDKKNDSSWMVCVKDTDVDDINDMTDKCSAGNEYPVACPGNLSGFGCGISGNTFIVTGVSHSAVKELINISGPLPTPTPTNCTYNWTCTTWSSCVNNLQTKTCTDSNNCNTTLGKPAETQSCGACTPDWTCTSWSGCVDGQQTKTCTDSNNCGTTTGKPAETQNCGSGEPVNWVFWIIIIILVIAIIVIAIFIIYFWKKKQGSFQTKTPFKIQSSQSSQFTKRF